MALDGIGNIYVVDSDNNRVQKFNASSGAFVKAWGRYGKLPGQFDGPTSVAIDRNSNVYVTDTGNGRVERFLANGTFHTYWNLTRLPGDQSLPTPYRVAADRANHLYV